jgi:hypothetical protein
MSMRASRPSVTSLVAFFLIVTPVVYVLSYAPVVRVCGRTVEYRFNVDIPFPQGTAIAPGFESGSEMVIQQQIADSSLYPMYGPVDWLIDHTPLRGPLLSWAGLWGVRDAFDLTEIERFLREQRRLRDPAEPALTRPVRQS